MKNFYISSFLIIILIGCRSTNQPKITVLQPTPKTDVNNAWYQKDFQQDNIPGISLDKWYFQNKKKPKNKNIIVAVIDTQIDLNHEDLQGVIWTNLKEISNNNIDDDNNGYIDDCNGWSFTGTKSGAYVVWNRYEYVRIVQEWGKLFKDKTESQIEPKDLYKFKEYQRALKTFEQKNKYYTNWLKSLKHTALIYPVVKDTLKYFFPKEDYTYKQLDSMYKKCKINDKKYRQMRDDNDKDLGALIFYMMTCLQVDQNTFEDVKDKETQLDSIVNKNLNLEYNERLSIGDNPAILEKGYGNNNVSNTIKGIRTIQDHNTMVSGVIAANRTNNKGIKGIAENVKIMPLNISPSGDEHDKDIVMAIRYAVDNGAKIINMSFGKEFSMHKDWVIDAFKYAQDHNILLVHSAGNSNQNIDENKNYPNDLNYDDSIEIFDNFINVGSTTRKLDNTFVSDFSNYGKQNVDLFAPGDEIYTTGAGNIYKTESGTSFSAPMVCGAASLIWSYYPKLTASQVKQIIMDSGTSYNLEVIVPGTKDTKVPFSELSKSGKVLNVYNAMQLAEKVNKIKKI
ncbi:S8 family serine peptidase [uncultured Flavobacterium sp.]|uniref:S8 family serine peptidase n=1 Tax=uncultured Flavobacterium sp. TaxID=165435 RepID=UPI00292EC45B|nr:S8 family serine peptidase [uncultured Flavobacterium sp.]